MSSAFEALLHQSLPHPASVSWKRDAPFDEEEAVPVRTGPWMNLLYKRSWKSVETSRTLRAQVAGPSSGARTESTRAFETQLLRKTKVNTYKTKTTKFKKSKDKGKLAHATHASNSFIPTVFSLLVVLQQDDLHTNTMSRGWEVSFWSFPVKFCKQNWEMLTYHQRNWWKNSNVECLFSC